MTIGAVTRVISHHRTGQISTPSLVKPFQDLKVGVRKDDGQSVVWAPALQILGDTNAAFAIEKSGCVGNFVTRY